MGPADQPGPPLLDRASRLRKDPEALADLWHAADAQMVALRGGAVAVMGHDAEGVRLGPLPQELRRVPLERRVLLGIDDSGRPWWLVRHEARADDAAVRWHGMRELAPRLTELQLDALMTAVALDSWHDRHGFCPACGQPTVPQDAGWVRRCSEDGTEHYPRTDPAIIAVVIDPDDRALLGRQTRWPPTWRSALAGFVEPGERAESAVRREVSEEVGLTIGRVRYLTSQPWPFPGSLMLGFHAWAQTTRITVDGEEIESAQWYTRSEMSAAAASGAIALPPPVLDRPGLIERWYGSTLPGSWLRG